MGAELLHKLEQSVGCDYLARSVRLAPEFRYLAPSAAPFDLIALDAAVGFDYEIEFLLTVGPPELQSCVGLLVFELLRRLHYDEVFPQRPNVAQLIEAIEASDYRVPNTSVVEVVFRRLADPLTINDFSRRPM